MEALADGSLAVTAIANGRVLACGGILNIGPGLGYAWLFGSTYLHENLLWFTKSLRDWVGATEQILNLHRLQTVCHVADTQGINWVEHLGFVAEGTLRRYDAHQGDYIMYARIREDN